MKKVTQKSSSKQESQADKFDYSKNEELVKYEMIDDSPFTKVWEADKGWHLLMGNYQLTEPMKDEKAFEKIVKEYTDTVNNRVVQVILCLIDSNNKNKLTQAE